MKKQKLLISFVIFILIICAGFVDKESNQNAAENKMDIGTIDGLIYKNGYLGVTLQIPADWDVPTKKTIEEVQSNGRKSIARDDAEKKAMLDDAHKNTMTLLVMSKYPVGTPNKENILFYSAAEPINKSQVRTGTDYLISMKEILAQKQIMQFSVTKDIYVKKIDNVDFSVLEMQVFIKDKEYTQLFYATIIKDYAYVFSFMYSDPEDIKFIKEIESTMKLRK